MTVWARNTTVPYMGLPAGRRIRLNIDDAYAIRNNIEGVKDVSPTVYLSNRKVNYQKESGEYPVRGNFPAAIDVEALVINKGRFF